MDVIVVFLAPAVSATYRIECAWSTTPGEPQVGPGEGPPPSATAVAAQAAPRIVASASVLFIAPPVEATRARALAAFDIRRHP
jgi:hypothetical protein